jgi:ankyrin repeat protein
MAGSSRHFVAAMLLRTLIAASLTITVLTEPGMAETRSALLLEAARNGDTRTVASLIQDGVALDMRDERGQTALLIATHANSIETARLLIEAGADVNAKDAIKDSAYLYAGARGHLEILRLTLSHGADLKSTNRYGGTALIPASERGHVETVQALIEAGIDVNHINDLGWTALIEAIILSDGGPRHQDIVKLLLDGGAKIDIADQDGITPLEHARTRGYLEIVNLLEAAQR